MSAVCAALSVARSNVQTMVLRDATWHDRRRGRTPLGDAILIAEIREQVLELPTYGYRRACALVNRQRKGHGTPRVNPKRAYRVMAQHQMLLPKAPKRRDSRRHEGTVAVLRSNTRWCSDGFEIGCDDGATVTSTFTNDCADRENITWRAWEGKGLPGEQVREMMIEAVEKRFGSTESIPKGCVLEYLSDNGSAYIANETRRIARQLGLTPINTPVRSPQSNGMAESFVNTFKRDYVSRMDTRDAKTVLAQLSAAFEHYNEVHPHSALKMMSPREFRQHQHQTLVEQNQRLARLDNQQALHCV